MVGLTLFGVAKRLWLAYIGKVILVIIFSLTFAVFLSFS
jgi:hypothetical protein